MKCPKCGYNNRGNLNFCGMCHESLDRAVFMASKRQNEKKRELESINKRFYWGLLFVAVLLLCLFVLMNHFMLRPLGMDLLNFGEITERFKR